MNLLSAQFFEKVSGIVIARTGTGQKYKIPGASTDHPSSCAPSKASKAPGDQISCTCIQGVGWLGIKDGLRNIFVSIGRSDQKKTLGHIRELDPPSSYQ